MSGGPYGRGNAPERACRNIEAWPEPDRASWMSALAPADPFADGGGARHRHRPLSNRKTERGYGRWLTFLDGQGLLDPAVPPADRITPDAVRLYVEELQRLQNRKATILSRLQELGEMAMTVAPAGDWRFIAQHARWVRGKPETPRNKRSRMVGSDRLLGLGLHLMAAAPAQSTPRQSAISFRDGLIIAVLALVPLRRGNFTSLKVGETLVRQGLDWIIDIPPEASKNHDPLVFALPELLQADLETYLRLHRPVLMVLVHRWTAPVGSFLWVSSHGSPMTEMALYDVVRKRTRAAFGTSLNPHLFRDEAATTLAIHDPDRARMAAALLGHRNLATTERYYQQAKTLEAHREYSITIGRMRQDIDSQEHSS